MIDQVVVLAGGLATRLGDLAEVRPKALQVVAGRPFIEHQLELLYGQGLRRVVLCVGHMAEQIEAVAGDGSRFGLEIAYSHDGPRPLGTGGAVRNALALLDDAFFVEYGDTYLRAPVRRIAEMFERSPELGLMTVFGNADWLEPSNVWFDGERIREYSKRERRPEMRHIDFGLSAFRREAIEQLPEDRPSDLADLFRSLLERGRLAGYEVFERFYEIGTPAALRATDQLLTNLISEGKGSNLTESSYSERHLSEAREILDRLDAAEIERMAATLAGVREAGGRLFILGVGGSAANASHAVNDFRKLCGFEAYAPTDNASELTARTNDEGWETVFSSWLEGSRLREEDGLLVFSVGGGDLERNVSPNLVRALQLAKEVGAKITGIVGRDGGYTARVADACVVVPTVNAETVTPHAEAFQGVVWHLLVSHPHLKRVATKWESLR